SSLVSIQPYGNKPPLFCIHAVAGNVIGYRPLAQSLDPDQPVYGLQARGLDGKQPPHVRVEEMASDYIREIKSVQTEGPYHFAGHSSGGVCAFEIARQLFERGEKVGVLAMIDTGSPGNFPLELRPDQYPNPWRAYSERIRYHLKHILFSSNRTTYLRQQLRRLRNRVQTSVSLARYQLNKMAGKSEPAALLRVGEAGFKAIYDYVPRYYHGEITLFLCTNKRPVGEQIPSDIGWRPFARSIQVRPMPGDHISILKDPDVQLLAKSLQECLDKSSEKKEELQKVMKVSLLTLIYHVANFIRSF
ncbi:thioesterase domain-containing protein, partial [bacterium]|nr:thioesterase domain-containing protein [bacterium]